MDSLSIDTEYIYIKDTRESPSPILHVSESCPGFRTTHSVTEEYAVSSHSNVINKQQEISSKGFGWYFYQTIIWTLFLMFMWDVAIFLDKTIPAPLLNFLMFVCVQISMMLIYFHQIPPFYEWGHTIIVNVFPIDRIFAIIPQ